MTAKPLSSHARKTWVILFSVMLGTSLQLSCQKSASSSAGAGGGVGGTTTAEEEVELEVSGTIDPTDFVQAQDSVEIGGVNLTTAGKYAISAFYLSPLGKKVPVYQGTSDSERFSFKSNVPKRYLTIDVTRQSDGYRLGAFLPPALRNKLAKLRLNRTSSIAAKMANIIADKAAAGDESAVKALSTNSISVADTLVLAQSVARVITEQETQNKGSSVDLAALTAKLIEKSNDKIVALQGEGQAIAVVAEKISEKTYETVFSGDAEATSPGVLAYRTNHDLGTSTIAKRDVAYEAIKDLSGDSTKYVDAAFRVEANAFRSASGLSDAVAAENSVATTYSTKFSECYAGNYNCAPAGYTPPSPPSSSTGGSSGGGNTCPENGWCASSMTYYIGGIATDLNIDGNGTWNGQTYTNGSLKAVITITAQPSSQTASNGSAAFSVTATAINGASLTYQWQKQEGGSGDFNNVGPNSATLNLSSLTHADDNNDIYRVVVSATGGATSVTSNAATLTVPLAQVDPYYQNVALLLHFEGLNTSSGFSQLTDNSPYQRFVNLEAGSLTTDVANRSPVGGTTSLQLSTYSDYFGNPPFPVRAMNSGLNAGTGDFTFEWWGKHIGTTDFNFAMPTGAILSTESDAAGRPVIRIDRSQLRDNSYRVVLNCYYRSTNYPYIPIRVWATDITARMGHWTHYAVSRTNGFTKVFINGSLATLGTSNDFNTGANVFDTTATSVNDPSVWDFPSESASQYNYLGLSLFGYRLDKVGGYADEVRYTVGKGRYSGSFDVPTAAFPDTGPIIVSDAPTSLAATGGDSQISLTWSAPSRNGGAAITDYVVQYSSNGGTDWTTFNDGTSTSVSAVVTGLTNGTSYIFKVAAVNSVGTGNFSSHSSSLAPAVSGGSGDASSTQGSSFCAVGSGVSGGFTYSGLTAGQCRDIFLDTCSNNADDTPCACGHPFPANSCTEYYQTTQVNSLPGVVSPIPQDTCPDALIEEAKTKQNQSDCESWSASYPAISIRWIQKQ